MSQGDSHRHKQTQFDTKPSDELLGHMLKCLVKEVRFKEHLLEKEGNQTVAKKFRIIHVKIHPKGWMVKQH